MDLFGEIPEKPEINEKSMFFNEIREGLCGRQTIICCLFVVCCVLCAMCDARLLCCVCAAGCALRSVLFRCLHAGCCVGEGSTPLFVCHVQAVCFVLCVSVTMCALCDVQKGLVCVCVL